MSELTDNLPKKYRAKKLGGITMVQPVPITLCYRKDMDALRETLVAKTGVRVTRAHILREGGLRYMKQLRVQLAKADAGVLHAKHRNENPQGSTMPVRANNTRKGKRK